LKKGKDKKGSLTSNEKDEIEMTQDVGHFDGSFHLNGDDAQSNIGSDQQRRN
jgi:hypothetical protein